MSAAASVTKTNFESEVLKASTPVLVDFWAVWCGPCRAIAPTVDQIAASYEGKVKVMKVNVDEEPEIASKYGVQSIPTLAVFKNGALVDQVVGNVPKDVITAKLDKQIG